MKRLLVVEAVSACIVLFIVMIAIQMAACGREEKTGEIETGQNETRISKDIWIYAGEMQETPSPLCQNTDAEKNIWSLCFSNPYQEGKQVENVEELKNFSYAGEKFRYSLQVHPEESKSYLTIRTAPALKTVSGDAVNADDLLFNYYLRADPDALVREPFDFAIDGEMEYYYGTANIKERQTEIAKRLEKPTKTLKEKINTQIILTELEREYQWVEMIFSDSAYQNLTHGYTSAAAFFCHFFSYQTAYTPGEKGKKEIISDIAGQYGTNYQALQKVTGKNYQDQVEKYALAEILKEKEDTINEIRGLKKIDQDTVQVTLSGECREVKKYLDFYLLPISEYGTGLVSIEKDSFLLKRGGMEIVSEKVKQYYKGSGAFYCDAPNPGMMCFYRNKYVETDQKKGGKIYILCNRGYTAKEIVEKMLERKLDIAIYPSDEHSVKLALDRGTGAAYKLHLLFMEEEKEYGILFRTDYINATTFPEKPTAILEIFQKLYKIKVNV